MFGFGKQNQEIPPHLDAVFVSETGAVRTDNQDNALVSVGHGAFCVSDGVGGGAEGAKASATVCHELKMMLHAVGTDFSDRISAARSSLVDSNAAVFSYARERGFAQMGATAAILVFDLQDATHAAVIHVGDSRVYRVRHGLGEPLTRDHRVLGGTMLTRAIGARQRLECDIREIDVQPGDRFVLCTDGVHGVVSDARIALFASGSTLKVSAERLADEVVRQGAPDNYTFVLVET